MVENQRERCRFSYLSNAIFQPPKYNSLSSMVLIIFLGILLTVNYPTVIIISMNVEWNGRQHIAIWKEKQFDNFFQLFYLYSISWFWLEKQFGGHPMSARNYIPIYETDFTRFWLYTNMTQLWILFDRPLSFFKAVRCHSFRPSRFCLLDRSLSSLKTV